MISSHYLQERAWMGSRLSPPNLVYRAYAKCFFWPNYFFCTFLCTRKVQTPIFCTKHARSSSEKNKLRSLLSKSKNSFERWFCVNLFSSHSQQTNEKKGTLTIYVKCRLSTYPSLHWFLQRVKRISSHKMLLRFVQSQQLFRISVRYPILMQKQMSGRFLNSTWKRLIK